MDRIAFSRTISAARKRSGWSVTWSSGKYGSPSGSNRKISSSSSSQPLPLRAEIGTMAANSNALWYASIRGSSFSFGRPSTLFNARIVFPRNRLARSRRNSSACGCVRLASTISSRTSMPSRAAATSCIIWRPSAESGECSPGVSIKTICPSGRVTIPWMRLRVVCGFEVTIATFCPTKRFNSVDFPALGRPTIATNPDRYFSLGPLFSSTPPLFSVLSVVSAASAVSAKCLLFGILLLYHWQLQRALVFRIMDQSDVRRLCDPRGFLRDDSSAVVILFGARAVRAMHEKPQTASLRDPPGEKCKIVENVFLCFPGSDKLFLPQRFAIPRAHGRPRQINGIAARQERRNSCVQSRVRNIHRQPHTQFQESSYFGGLAKELAVIYRPVSVSVQHRPLRG